MYGLPSSECVCCACDPNERLSAPSICFVCVFVSEVISSFSVGTLYNWELQ